jgi:hypothetical protein
MEIIYYCPAKSLFFPYLTTLNIWLEWFYTLDCSCNQRKRQSMQDTS